MSKNQKIKTASAASVIATLSIHNAARDYAIVTAKDGKQAAPAEEVKAVVNLAQAMTQSGYDAAFPVSLASVDTATWDDFATENQAEGILAILAAAILATNRATVDGKSAMDKDAAAAMAKGRYLAALQVDAAGVNAPIEDVGTFTIVSGHTRFLAAIVAGVKPAYVWQDSPKDAAELTAAQFEGNKRNALARESSAARCHIFARAINPSGAMPESDLGHKLFGPLWINRRNLTQRCRRLCQLEYSLALAGIAVRFSDSEVVSIRTEDFPLPLPVAAQASKNGKPDMSEFSDTCKALGVTESADILAMLKDGKAASGKAKAATLTPEKIAAMESAAAEVAESEGLRQAVKAVGEDQAEVLALLDEHVKPAYPITYKLLIKALKLK